jgi:hypothetical protein
LQSKKAHSSEWAFTFERNRRLLRGFRFLLVGLGRFRRGFDRQIDPFQNGALSRVALPLVKADNSRITPAAFFEERSDLVKQDVHDIFVLAPGDTGRGPFSLGCAFEVTARVLSQSGGGKTPVMNCAALAKRDHFLSDGAGCFGFGESGRHAPVLDQTADQVRQHRISMFELAAQFSGAFKVSHNVRD